MSSELLRLAFQPSSGARSATPAALPLLARLLETDPAGLSVVIGPSGKPRLDVPHHDLHFNLAHAGGLVVVAATTAGPVGVDLEPAGRDLTGSRLIRRFFTAGEQADVAAAPDPGRRALEIWTLKEALVKAEGVSIYQARRHLDLASVRLASGQWTQTSTPFGPRWLRPLPCPRGFLGALAFQGSVPPEVRLGTAP